MHVDLDVSRPDETFHATACILGGGIAGLILATRLARQGIDVNLLEAGGLEFEERSQAEYEAVMAASTHKGSTEGRFRSFGGSSTRWGGQLLPYTPDVFNPPQGSPSPPWPISEADLSPYYEEVQTILGADSLPFTGELLPALGHPALPASDDILVRFSKWAPYKKRNLARTLGAEALAHPRIKVFTHANAVTLSTDPASPHRIHAVQAINYARQPFLFTAIHFVVCAGTIESARLLLASPAVPDAHGQVGRFFHDHLSFAAARFTAPASERAVKLLGPFFVKGTTHSCKLEASASLRGRKALHAVMAHVVIVEPEDSGPAAVRNLLRSVQSGRIKEAVAINLGPFLRGIGDVARLFIHAHFRKRRAVSKRAVLHLNIDVEQAPHPDHRILLSLTEATPLGMPKAIVQWSIGAPEQRTVQRFLPIVRQYLQTLGISPRDWAQSVIDDTPPEMVDTYHAMGGLRMGVDPAASVVDNDLFVHSLDNLSIASCAVFPSGGSSNPTFTLMALTLRLASHLGKLLTAEPR